jgi:hypothetical protein
VPTTPCLPRGGGVGEVISRSTPPSADGRCLKTGGVDDEYINGVYLFFLSNRNL